MTDIFNGTMGKMPERFFENTIAEMEIGQDAWAVPWALSVDNERNCYLNTDYTVYPEPGGAVTMLVKRTGDGYAVDISRCKDYKWSRREACYVGGGNLVPILALRTGNGPQWNRKQAVD